MRYFRSDDHVGIYLKDMTRCVSSLKDCGDRRASRIVALLPLAVYLAKRYRGRGIDFDDLIQVANQAVVEAFDSWRGKIGSLDTHVGSTIRWALVREIRINRTCIRGVNDGEYRGRAVVSINKRLRKGRREMGDTLVARNGKPQFDADAVRRLLSAIEGKDKMVIERRLAGMNRNEVAELEGVTPKSIAYIEKRALKVMFDSVGRPYSGQSLQELGVVSAHQRRSPRLHLVTAFGETKSLSEWCKEMGFENPGTIKHRLKQGMRPEDALLTPSRRA